MIKEFLNGNLHIKLEVDSCDIERIDESQAFIELVECLEERDVYLVSDEWSAGNYDVGYTFYCARLDRIYILIYGRDLLGTILKRNTLILKAIKPIKNDYECMSEYFRLNGYEYEF